MRKLILLTLIGLLPSFAFSQHYFHTGFWTRLALNGKLTPKLSFTAEAGLRRQNSLYHLSPVEKPQTNNIKLTLNYQIKNLNLILSPYENIHSDQLLGKEADLLIPRLHEMRFSGGLEYVKAKAKSRFQLRSIYEYRIFTSIVRPRIRTRFLTRFNLNPKSTLTFYDEVFVNIPPNRLPNWFNQNRLASTFTRSLTPHLDFEVGYVYVFSERFTLTEYDHTNGLIMYLTVKL